MRLALVLAVIGLAACQPEIATGSYYCGANLSCPSGQECDQSTFVCRVPVLVEPFRCPDGSEVAEPDDGLESAADLGDTACGEFTVKDYPGCLPTVDDEDWITVFHDQECVTGQERLAVSIAYPNAFAALGIEIVAEDGSTLATSEVCNDEERFSGTQISCVSTPLQEGLRYFVRVHRTGENDCAGDCQYNHYELALITEL